MGLLPADDIGGFIGLMRITIKLFAVLKDLAGIPELAMEVPAGCTAGDALAKVVEKLPAISAAARRSAVAVNLEYAAMSCKLSQGDEIALIPPVSGG